MIMEEPLLIYKKKELRKKMLALRRALSTDETDKMAMCLRANIVSLPQYKKANRIMAFLAMRGESNLDPLIGQALADEKEIYIPVCLPERQMGAGRLFSMSGFTKGPLGLRNLPAPYTMIAPEDLDLVLVPAVACGVDGTRLGMGAGYYDRYLERVSLEKRVSVLWDFQVMDSVPNGIYDKYISKIVTKARLNPDCTASRKSFPDAISSLNLSKINTFASTAIPIDKIIPAILGSVNVAWST